MQKCRVFFPSFFPFSFMFLFVRGRACVWNTSSKHLKMYRIKWIHVKNSTAFLLIQFAFGVNRLPNNASRIYVECREGSSNTKYHLSIYYLGSFFPRLRDQDFSSSNTALLKRGLSQYFKSSSSSDDKRRDVTKEQVDSDSSDMKTNGSESTVPALFLLPLRTPNDAQKSLFGSYNAMLGQLRDQVLFSKLSTQNLIFACEDPTTGNL